MQRDFTATRPNELWIVDFTYVPTWAGTGFTAFVKDVYSRRLVGWRTHHQMPTELPLDALEMALWVRGRAGHDVTGVVHHSDAGSQYTAIRYADRLAEAGALASIGTVGDSYDNALAEAFNSLFKAELVRNRGPWKNIDELEIAIAEYVDWFNHRRLHGLEQTLGLDLLLAQYAVGREGLPGAQHSVLTFHQLVQLLKLAHVLHLPFMLILYAKLARK